MHKSLLLLSNRPVQYGGNDCQGENPELLLSLLYTAIIALGVLHSKSRDLSF